MLLLSGARARLECTQMQQTTSATDSLLRVRPRKGSPFCSTAHAVPTCLLQQSAVSATHGDQVMQGIGLAQGPPCACRPAPTQSVWTRPLRPT